MYNGRIYPNVDISTSYAVHTKNGERLELLLLHRPDETVKSTLLLCLAIEWAEGILIVEREIARRGLNAERPQAGRFEL